MVEHLCKLIRDNNNCLDTGFLSVLFLMDVLCENGKRDIAYQLLFQTKCRNLHQLKIILLELEFGKYALRSLLIP